MNRDWKIWAGGLVLAFTTLTATAQTSGSSSSSSSASSSHAPTTSTGAHAASISLPILDSSAPKRVGLLSYSRTRYRTVTGYADFADPRLVSGASVNLYYQPVHARINEIELFADYYQYQYAKPRGGDGGGLKPGGPGLIQQAFPAFGTRLPGPDGTVIRPPQR